jgi:hypothetical protein
VSAIRRRQQTLVKTNQAKTQKVQPRYSPGSQLIELSNAGINEQMSVVPLSGMSSEAELTRPTIVSSSAGHDDQNREEEDREVFEL